jgi:hypothetical protein
MDFRDIGDEGGRWMELILNPVHNWFVISIYRCSNSVQFIFIYFYAANLRAQIEHKYEII